MCVLGSIYRCTHRRIRMCIQGHSHVYIGAVQWGTHMHTYMPQYTHTCAQGHILACIPQYVSQYAACICKARCGAIYSHVSAGSLRGSVPPPMDTYIQLLRLLISSDLTLYAPATHAYYCVYTSHSIPTHQSNTPAIYEEVSNTCLTTHSVHTRHTWQIPCMILAMTQIRYGAC
jgi:hypothetical protein